MYPGAGCRECFGTIVLLQQFTSNPVGPPLAPERFRSGGPFSRKPIDIATLGRLWPWSLYHRASRRAARLSAVENHQEFSF